MDESENIPDSLPYPRWNHIKRRFAPKDDFFIDGDLACGFVEKYIVSEYVDSSDSDSRMSSFPCGISGCKEEFDSIISYEHHYKSLHLHNCSVCSRSFPTNHLLSIHILEWHDPVFEIKAAKQDMHQCLIESCAEKFRTPKHRKKHMIEVHKYPSNYRFDQAKKTKCSISKENIKSDDKKMEIDINIDQTTPGKLASHSENTAKKRTFNCKVPKSVCFGKGTSKAFQHLGRKKKHWHQVDTMDTETVVHIEKINMRDLSDALSDTY